MKKRKMKESTVQFCGALGFFLMGMMCLVAAYLDIPTHSYYEIVNIAFEKLGTPVVATFCAVFCFVLSGVCVKQALDEQKKELREASTSDT